MRSGTLRRVIKVQRATETINEAGTAAQTWSDIATLRAEVVRQSVEEFLSPQGARDESVVVFRTRFFSDLFTSDRVAFDGDHWNIREIAEIGNQRGLEIRCTTSGFAA